MSYELLASVITEIDRRFSPADAATVRARLADTPLPLGDNGPVPRIHHAIVWLSDGKMHEFERALEIATIDWRDTLVAAGLGNVNWREVMVGRGVSLDRLPSAAEPTVPSGFSWTPFTPLRVALMIAIWLVIVAIPVIAWLR